MNMWRNNRPELHEVLEADRGKRHFASHFERLEISVDCSLAPCIGGGLRVQPDGVAMARVGDALRQRHEIIAAFPAFCMVFAS